LTPPLIKLGEVDHEKEGDIHPHPNRAEEALAFLEKVLLLDSGQYI